MARFLSLKKGGFINTNQVVRVYHSYPKDKPVESFALTVDNEDLELSHSMDQVERDLGTILPSHGEKIFHLYLDDSAENPTIEHVDVDVYQALGWVLRPGSDTPEPITASGQISNANVLIELPDGKLEFPYVRTFDNLDDAKQYILEQHGLKKKL